MQASPSVSSAGSPTMLTTRRSLPTVSCRSSLTAVGLKLSTVRSRLQAKRKCHRAWRPMSASTQSSSARNLAERTVGHASVARDMLLQCLAGHCVDAEEIDGRHVGREPVIVDLQESIDEARQVTAHLDKGARRALIVPLKE